MQSVNAQSSARFVVVSSWNDWITAQGGKVQVKKKTATSTTPGNANTIKGSTLKLWPTADKEMLASLLTSCAIACFGSTFKGRFLILTWYLLDYFAWSYFKWSPQQQAHINSPLLWLREWGQYQVGVTSITSSSASRIAPTNILMLRAAKSYLTHYKDDNFYLCASYRLDRNVNYVKWHWFNNTTGYIKPSRSCSVFCVVHKLRIISKKHKKFLFRCTQIKTKSHTKSCFSIIRPCSHWSS